MKELHRIGVKVFCTSGAELDLAEVIPIFHRWIQQKRTSHMLIDVADYTHVPSGPGILLVADEGNYSIDDNGGRRGFTFYRKRPLDGRLSDRLASVTRDAVAGAMALASEPELTRRLAFSGAELQVYFNDRLLAPNSDASFAALEPDLAAFFGRVFGEGRSELVRSRDPRDRLTVSARSSKPADLTTLAARLAG